ncbi:MAG: glycosyl transferase [Pyrinomonas sp.]|uniref:glycosyltransferase n=1 Tax=Pyrinomonas sp. TaxID=2080306 RepID=UPI00332BD818
MRINWFSPLPPAHTDIAHYTHRILRPLSEKAAIILWTDQSEWDPEIKTYAEVKRFTLGKFPWHAVNNAEISFFHIGNNPLFHYSIWRLSRFHPGIVVLHDVVLQNLFAGIYWGVLKDTKAYVEQMKRFYGESGEQEAMKAVQDRNVSPLIPHYPLTELAIENALGVLVHNLDVYQQLKQKLACPVAYLPLPFDLSKYRIERNKERGKAPPYRLIVFGYLGTNRCLDVLLKALASFPQKDSFRLDIYGKLEEKWEIQALISSLGLREKVTVHGFVPEQDLDSALSSAHLAINMRYPTMGEASGSQMRIWAHALPSLVTKTGWFATLPSDTVAFVNPDSAIHDIHLHLSSFIEDPMKFDEMGRRGRLFLERNHLSETYAEGLIEFAKEVNERRSYATANYLVDRTAREITTLGDGQGLSARRVATEIAWVSNFFLNESDGNAATEPLRPACTVKRLAHMCIDLRYFLKKAMWKLRRVYTIYKRGHL